jgi:hypothetical protein
MTFRHGTGHGIGTYGGVHESPIQVPIIVIPFSKSSKDDTVPCINFISKIQPFYTLQNPIHSSIHSIHSYSNTEIPKNQFALKVFIFTAAFSVPLFDYAHHLWLGHSLSKEDNMMLATTVYL